MRILELHVQGFRSLKDVTWKPGKLNVLIGPNGTGKSNLLRLLELLSVSAQGRLGRHIQAAGGMEPLVWDGASREITIAVKTSPIIPGRSEERDALTYSISLARLGESSSYKISHELLGNYYRMDRGERPEPFKFLEREGMVAHVFDNAGNGLMVPQESLSEEESLLSIASGPFSYNQYIPPYQRELAGWSLYHDLHVNQGAAIRQPAVARMEKRVSPDGQNLINVLHTLYTGDRDFKKEIDLAMRAAFGDDFEELVFPPAADQRIQLRMRWKSLRREQSASDLSDGTLRFLALLAVFASPSAAPIIAVDEPETGLHPSMLPIVAEYAVEASRRAQVIMTTHSPALLDAFDEDDLPQATIASWEGGQTILRTIRGNVLDQWLENYSMGELMSSSELERLAEMEA